jgi:hypothetical protein
MPRAVVVSQESHVERLTQMVNSLLQLLIQLGDVVVARLQAIEAWLHAQLTTLGVPAELQTVITLALAALLILAVVRLFGGLIRIIVVVVLLLVAVRLLLPVLPH